MSNVNLPQVGNGAASTITGDEAASADSILKRDSNGDGKLRRLITPNAFGGLSNLGFLYAGLVSAATNTTADEGNTGFNGFSYLIDCSGGARTFTPPDATTCFGKLLAVMKKDSSANALTIDPAGTQTTNGQTLWLLLAQWDCVIFQSDGANWVILAAHLNQTVFVQTADSTAITNTAAETSYDASAYTFPANSLRAGDIIDIEAQILITAHTGADTLTNKLKIGGTVLASSGAVNNAANDVCTIRIRVIIRTAGAGGTFTCYGFIADGAPGTVTDKPITPVTGSIDTTANQALSLTGQWSASTASDSAKSQAFTVRRAA